jgi:MSHA biogenesis protein MshQ
MSLKGHPMSRTTRHTFRHITALALLWLWASMSWAATGTLSVLSPSATGYVNQSYISGYLKTVDFATATLANSTGISQGTSTLNSGTWVTTSSSVPTGFTGAYAKLSSKDGSNSSASTIINYTNGTDYVSFLWHLGSADNDNTVTFNLSDGSSQTIANCGSNTTSCVGGYDTDGYITSLFSWLTCLFTCGGTGSTTTLRVVYMPPSGVVINSMTLKATSIRVCVLLIFCSYQTRSLDLDGLSYDDDSTGVLNPNGVLNHLEIYADTSKPVTCAATTMRVRACANAACTTPYTAGVTGTLKLTNGGTVKSAAYTIASGSSYSPNVAITANSVGTWVASATSSATVTGTNTCALGALTTSSACSFTTSASGIVVTLAPHYVGATQPMTVQLAVAGDCTPLLSVVGNLLVTATPSFSASGSPTLTDSLGVAHSLSSGSAVAGIPIGVSLGGLGSNNFKANAGGTVKMSLSVAGVSNVLLNGLLSLTGDVVTRVVPKKLRLVPALNGTDLTAGTSKISAGSTFQLKIQGEDTSGNLIALDPDLSVLSNLALTKTVVKPTGANLNNDPDLDTTPVALVSNIATMDVGWDEVGTISLSSTGITNFMGTGLDVAAGLISGFNLKFVPAKFAVTAAPPCSDGTSSFAYAGQPLSVKVQALNASNVITKNYDGTAALAADRVANAVTVSAVSGLTNGTLSGNSLADTTFDNGEGVGTITDTLAASKKLSAPENVGLNASDTDVSSNASTPTVLVRSGRIKLSNAYGNEGTALAIPLQVQYWDGKAWVPARDTACAVAANIPSAAVVKANLKSHKGATLLATALPVSLKTLALTNGAGTITLNPPGKGFTGTVDVTLDLSASGANMSWLQSLDISCGANTLCNPKARASFGVYAPETQKTVNVRNVY